MQPKKPPPAFEVWFEGRGILPENIPLTTLSRALSAVQRLATGETATDEERDNALSLLDIKRGSARFAVAARSPHVALANLRHIGSIVENHAIADQIAFAFNPIEELSAVAKSLGCKIIIRPSKARDVIATIEPLTYSRLASALLIEGSTTITGIVQRVGGAGEMRCALRVTFQSHLLYCNVATTELARELGQRLYESVAVSGTARWIRNSWSVVSFTIREMYQPEPGSLREAFKELREAGGKAWDDIADPVEYLRRVTGD